MDQLGWWTGRSTTSRAPTERGGVDDRRAVVEHGDPPDQREAEARPRRSCGLRVRCSSSRVNRSNTRSRSASGMPGAVVVDQQPDPPVALVHREPHGGAGVAPGVVEQVDHGPAQLGAAAVDQRGLGSASTSIDTRRPLGGPTPGLLGGQLGDVDDDVLAGRPLVERGQQQQVGDDGLEPRLLGRGAARPRPATRRGRPCAGPPRARCGWPPRGCAARGRRRPRSAAGGWTRPRGGRAWRSWCVASRATSSPVPGTGTRRSSVEPEIASTSARIELHRPQGPAGEDPRQQRHRGDEERERDEEAARAPRRRCGAPCRGARRPGCCSGPTPLAGERERARREADGLGRVDLDDVAAWRERVQRRAGCPCPAWPRRPGRRRPPARRRRRPARRGRGRWGSGPPRARRARRCSRSSAAVWRRLVSEMLDGVHQPAAGDQHGDAGDERGQRW